MRCAICGSSLGDGEHALSEEARTALPPSFCPKCSGGPDDAHPRCATQTTLFYRCGCGVRWTTPHGIVDER